MNATAEGIDAIIADAYFPALRDHIISSTGLVFFARRPTVLAGHVAERLNERGLGGCREYLELLQDNHVGETELDRLIALLTIGETYFFRHPELFDALRDIALPEIIERNRSTKRLRVWSAGCSTGPEAYSVSILLRRELGHAIQGWNISIVGTDINRPFLSQAAEGRYEEWAFRGTTPAFRCECFEKEDQSWRITPRFRDGVSFQYHNLARNPFPSLVHNLAAFDLILCRNVLIYFAPEFIERFVSRLAECLAPNGWLAVGHAEHGAHLQTSFNAVNCRGVTLYRKLEPRAGKTGKTASDHLQRAKKHPVVHPLTSGLAKHVARDGCLHDARRVGPPPAAHSCRKSIRSSASEIEQIRRLADQGDLAAALELCKAMIAGNNFNPVCYYYQSLIFEQIGQHDAALDALNKAIYLDRDFDLAHYHLGLTQRKLGDLPAAAKSFREVLNQLEHRDPSQRLPDAEGMTVADLVDLTHIHLESLDAT